MKEKTEKNGWYEWKNHVLLELQRMNKNIECLEGKINTMQGQLTMLKIKASLWGTLAGSIPVIVIILLRIVKVI